MSAEKPRRLGRGLEALLNVRPISPALEASMPVAPAADRGAFQKVTIGEIRPNPYQPRKHFAPDELTDLEASLRVNGLLQPVTVRPAPTGNGYELIAGERRLRAATRLGWSEIPAVIKDVDDRTLLTLALVENLQRADLNPLEQADGYQRLIEEFSLTQQEVAEVVGKDRSTVANMLRLLNLPASIRRMLQEGHLTLGHARALLAVGNEHRMLELARETVAKGLTVRDIEERARQASTRKPKRTTPPSDAVSRASSPESRRIADDLRKFLQTDVKITLTSADRGTIEIAFYSAEDLERLLEQMMGTHRLQSP
ncbi:MAG: ParB/RepB/Spo0J family partition protein [Gemmatimonadaceae bacterium]